MDKIIQIVITQIKKILKINKNVNLFIKATIYWEIIIICFGLLE